jgi:hypothetical protein
MKNIYYFLKCNKITLIIIFLSIFSFPVKINPVEIGLDNSWLFGLYAAFDKNLQFGKDVIITFGPLGFLFLPLFYNLKLWFISIIVNFIIHIVFISIFFKYYFDSIKKKIFFVPLIIIPFLPQLTIDYKILFIGITLMLMLINEKPVLNIFFYLLTINIILAFGALIKFSIFIMNIYLLFILLIYFFYNKKITNMLFLVFSYVLSIIVVWLLLNQSIENIYYYISNGMEISTGYNDSMAIWPSMPWKNILMIFISILMFVIISIEIVLSLIKKNFVALMCNLLIGGIGFFIYKHGIVRQDDSHVFIFYMFLTLLLLMYFYHNQVYFSNYPILKKVNISIFVIIYFLSGFLFYKNFTSIIDNFNLSSKARTIVAISNTHDAIILNSKEKIKKHFIINEDVIKKIANKKVDIIPEDISLAYGYEFNWKPRPIFQSYTAYSVKLDEINSLHFKNVSDVSPDYLLYRYNSIDNRYPLFDEPLTLMKIIENYSNEEISNDFLILRKNLKSEIIKNVLLEKKESKFGQYIEIPYQKDVPVFASIQIEANIIGKIVKFLYKPSLVYIKFKLKNNHTTKKYRLIINNLENGILVSDYVENLGDLQSLILQDKTNLKKITGIIIEPNHLFYFNDKINITFFKSERQTIY